MSPLTSDYLVVGEQKPALQEWACFAGEGTNSTILSRFTGDKLVL